MSQEISWLSAVIAISSGVIGVGVTCIVNYTIANKNRKEQHDMDIKEMELKEKIEYHKLAIDHTIMIMNRLIEWNVNYNNIISLKAKKELAEQNKEKDEVLCGETRKLLVEASNNLTNLYVFISDNSRGKIEELQTNVSEKLSKLSSEKDIFLKSSIILDELAEIHTIVLSEIGSLKKKIDTKVSKYLE